MNEPAVLLSLGSQVVDFLATPLVFSAIRTADLFARKNNKTVGETLRHRKYVALAPRILTEYSGFLDVKLGNFVAELKTRADPLYQEFLNKHGGGLYCEFSLREPSVQQLKGLYCFVVEGNLKYIGRATDSFGKRINQGYGRIHPKNCYRDGQSTNCHLNALIAAAGPAVRLHVHAMVDDSTIKMTESALIVGHNPEWNVQLRRNRG